MNREEAERTLLQQRKLLLDKDIDRRVVAELRVHLLGLALESDEPITLIINSKGGDIDQALWLTDMIRLTAAPVIGFVIGECNSAAILVLQTCQKRYATKHSELLLHSVETPFKIDSLERLGAIRASLKRRIADNRNAQEATEQLLSKRTGRTVEEIRVRMLEGRDFRISLTAAEAKEFGLLDEVVEEGELFAPSQRRVEEF